MDLGHLWRALRYVELNPIRAGLAGDRAAYPWSSTAAHCGRRVSDAVIDLLPWCEWWRPLDWTEYLQVAVGEDETQAIQQCTHSGRPLGTADFVRGLEKALGRRLVGEKGGRPRKNQRGTRQEALALG